MKTSIPVLRQLFVLLSCTHLALAGSKPLKAKGRTVGEDSYCYGDSPECGEDTYPEHCKTGSKQTPIDLPDISTLKEVGIIDEFPSVGHLMDRFTLINSHMNLDVMAQEEDSVLDLRFSFPPLNHTYKFYFVNFHWASENGDGSLHAINGKKYDFEMHVVYYREDFDTFNAAKDNEDDIGSIAAIGILFEYDKDTRPLSSFKSLREGIDQLEKEDEYTSDGTLNMDKLLRFNKAYWYLGSIDRPPCTENVLWIVSPTPLKISGEDLEAFRKIHGADGKPIKTAFRRLQPLRSHIIHRVGVRYITRV